METSRLRNVTSRESATIPKAKLWPNGIGFDAQGWSFLYNEINCCWVARRKYADGSYRIGSGMTAAIAKGCALASPKKAKP